MLALDASYCYFFMHWIFCHSLFKFWSTEVILKDKIYFFVVHKDAAYCVHKIIYSLNLKNLL